MITYWNSGGICNQRVFDQLFNKLDMVIDDGNFIFANVNLAFLYVFLILMIDFCIRLGNNWKGISQVIRCKTSWWRNINAVHSSSDQPSSEMLQLVDYVNHYELGPSMILLLCWMFLQTLNLLTYSSVAFNQVFIDYALFGFPIYLIFSSKDILSFVNLKYNQLKYRMGYF